MKKRGSPWDYKYGFSRDEPLVVEDVEDESSSLEIILAPMTPPRAADSQIRRRSPTPPTPLEAAEASPTQREPWAIVPQAPPPPPSPAAEPAPPGWVQPAGGKKGRGKQANHVCFTANNYVSLPALDDIHGCSYLAWQEEVAASGTPHLQGYLQLDYSTRLQTVTNALSAACGNHVRTAAATGSDQENYNYISKPSAPPAITIAGSFVELGVRKAIAGKRGARNDLAQVQRAIDGGATMPQVARDHFAAFVRYRQGLEAYSLYTQPDRDWIPEIIVYVGPSGTGKSRAARARFPNAFWCPSNAKWYDMYHGQDTIIFDEFYGGCMPFRDLLRVLDSSPLQVERKGGFVKMRARTYVFTTNIEPEDWYDEERIHTPWADNPLNRRLREWGTIIRTGEIHRRVRPRLNEPELYGAVDPNQAQ